MISITLNKAVPVDNKFREESEPSWNFNLVEFNPNESHELNYDV